MLYLLAQLLMPFHFLEHPSLKSPGKGFLVKATTEAQHSWKSSTMAFDYQKASL